MSTSMQPYKGARDFYPEDKQVQKWIFDKWRRVVERYGYVEYDAPILEPTDLYLMKGSQEIIETQTYTFKDRGDRSVTIRTEMTPSVSRMVAGRRQEIAYPARWYSIPNLWRYERMQKGRLREFWQLNVDMFGVSSVQAEIEMIEIVDDLFQAFKAKRSSYTIKINSRVLVTEILSSIGISAGRATAVIRLVDRINKMSTDDFAKALDEATGAKEISRALVEYLSIKEIEDLPISLQASPSARSIANVINTARAEGIRNIEFDVTLMRGFDYYTDILFEAFATDGDNNRSVLGGGRYDGLVGLFGVEPVPTIGFAVGDVVFRDFLETNKLVSTMKLPTELTLIIRDEDSVKGAHLAARELREIGVNVSVDYSGRKVDKQFKNALKFGVRYVLFIGKEELETEQYTLKDTKTGNEEKHSLARIVSIVKDQRK